MKFFLVGDKETVLGFSLAGVEGVAAESAQQALSALRRAVRRRDVGICLITEKLAEQLRPHINKMLLQKKGAALILEIPDRLGPLPGKRSVEDFALSALGIKV
ncbi:MAG: V-type ATP synthase subunit F [bacterium]